MADLRAQLLQGVVGLRQLVWRRQRAARNDAVDVVRARIRIVVDETRFGVLAHLRRRQVQRKVVHVLLRIGGPVAVWILEFGAGRRRSRAVQPGVALVVVAGPGAESVGTLDVERNTRDTERRLLHAEVALVVV